MHKYLHFSTICFLHNNDVIIRKKNIERVLLPSMTALYESVILWKLSYILADIVFNEGLSETVYMMTCFL